MQLGLKRAVPPATRHEIELSVEVGARRHEASLSWVSLDAVGRRRPRLAGAWVASGTLAAGPACDCAG